MDDDLVKLDSLLGLDSGQNRQNGVCDKGIFFIFFPWIFLVFLFRFFIFNVICGLGFFG